MLGRLEKPVAERDHAQSDAASDHETRIRGEKAGGYQEDEKTVSELGRMHKIERAQGECPFSCPCWHSVPSVKLSEEQGG